MRRVVEMTKMEGVEIPACVVDRVSASLGKCFYQAEDFSCSRVEEGLESFEGRDVEYP